MSTIDAKGFREIERNLIALGSKDGTKVIRRALLVAAAPIEEQAKHDAPSRSGSLRLSIGRRFAIRAKSGVSTFLPGLGGRFSAVVAPLKSNRVAAALHNLVYGRSRKVIYHGHFIEFEHRTRGSGSVRAEPFLGPALRARTRDAVSIFRAEVKAGIASILRRRQ